MKDTAPVPFEGEVEADETFVGGKQRATQLSAHGARKSAHGPATGKATVFGIIQRGEHSRVRAMVVPDHKRVSLLPRLRENVKPGSFLYTDALRSYRNIPEFQHAFVDHMVEYVKGRVHTNTIENFWSCLKRGLKGTYIAARPFHLQAYVDEQVFRFNEREDCDAGRFVKALKGADGRRVTYAVLTTSHPLWRLKPGRAARAMAH
jgi:transposase-like protein